MCEKLPEKRQRVMREIMWEIVVVGVEEVIGNWKKKEEDEVEGTKMIWQEMRHNEREREVIGEVYIYNGRGKMDNCKCEQLFNFKTKMKF